MLFKKQIRSLRQRFMHAFPHAYIRLSRWASRNVLFREERAALRAGRARSSSDQVSILFFGGYRAASMLVSGILRELSVEQGLKSLDWERYFVHTDRTNMKLMKDGEWAGQHLPASGFFFGPLRGSIAVDKENYRGLAMVRHPLDVCVSHYYAVRDAHTLIDEEYLRRREKAKEQTVEQYAVDIIDEVAEQYFDFLELAKSEQVLLSKYEDMAADFPAWFAGVCDHLALKKNGPVYTRVLKETKLVANSTDTFAHQRSGKAKQYIKSLSPSVIEQVVAKHPTLFEALGYEVELS